jgi:hypothetical protein
MRRTSDFEAQAALLIRAIRSLIENVGPSNHDRNRVGQIAVLFIPIIDAAIRARAPARTPRYRDLSDESAGEQPDQLRPTFACYKVGFSEPNPFH